MKAHLFYTSLRYSMFSTKRGGKHSGKHSPDFNYTEGCLIP